ncbi:GSCFA domain-containing protein [Alteromonas sp. ASW11-36]|uniref:GSCFA domain-containing protein n=1 Tax=Alteromonas arenosi TaxID=3055817 RepID=A0ABT7SZB5_9ALTE|nr:GSCFA domain-containing protein [Alteromonas sp. ASW11-36]MDM7861349.1 GSCFA domain-containing protein [Alteromonas sp. ASW11-36]
MKDLVFAEKHRQRALSINIESSPVLDSFNKKVVATGSCFAYAISKNLNDLGFKTQFDGRSATRFSVKSFASYMQHLIELPSTFTDSKAVYVDSTYKNQEKDVITSTLHNGLYGINTDLDMFSQQCFQIDKTFKDKLKNADLVIVTLGTSQYLKLKRGGHVVTNFQGIDRSEFDFIEPTTSEVTIDVQNILKALEILTNESAMICFTVSPQRYAWGPIGDFKDQETDWNNELGAFPKDGLVANCYDKSKVRVALQDGIQATSINRNIRYFPSYEMVLDELRSKEAFGVRDSDYGHVAQTTSAYVVNRFVNKYMSDELKRFIEVQKNFAKDVQGFKQLSIQERVAILVTAAENIERHQCLPVPETFVKPLRQAYKQLLNSGIKIEPTHRLQLDRIFASGTDFVADVQQTLEQQPDDIDIILYGAGISAKNLLEKTDLLNRNIVMICDRNAAAIDKFFGFKVQPPEALARFPNAKLLISAQESSESIIADLSEQGIRRDRII